MERLIRLLALTLLFAVLFVSGVIGRKPHERADAGVRTSTVTETYRGLSAVQWAGKFRRMRHLAYRRELRRRRDVHAAIQDGYGSSWLERAFLCIHRYEGSWADGGAPYWGGLQMDGDFMRHYGGWALKAFGTADRWPVSVQLSTAIQAKVSGRGFYPWPNTARACGLL